MLKQDTLDAAMMRGVDVTGQPVAPNANMNTAPAAGAAPTTVYVDNPTTPWYTVCRRI